MSSSLPLSFYFVICFPQRYEYGMKRTERKGTSIVAASIGGLCLCARHIMMIFKKSRIRSETKGYPVVFQYVSSSMEVKRSKSYNWSNWGWGKNESTSEQGESSFFSSTQLFFFFDELNLTKKQRAISKELSPCHKKEKTTVMKMIVMAARASFHIKK